MSLLAEQAAGPKECKTTSLRVGRDRDTEKQKQREIQWGRRQWGTETAASIPAPRASLLPLLSNGTSHRYILGRSPPSRGLTSLSWLRLELPSRVQRVVRTTLDSKVGSGRGADRAARSGERLLTRLRQCPATLPAPAVSRQGPEVVRWGGGGRGKGEQ